MADSAGQLAFVLHEILPETMKPIAYNYQKVLWEYSNEAPEIFEAFLGEILERWWCGPAGFTE